MAREFSKYGDLITNSGISGELITYNLVDHDWPLHNVEQLFGCQNPNVEYCASLVEAIAKIKTTNKKLVFYPTQIPVCQKIKRKVHDKGTHSVVLIVTTNVRQKTIYFFDPNGVYNIKTHNILYNLGGACNSTDIWIDRLKEETGEGEIYYLTVSGPQYYYNETDADDGYILQGGYCMFFNYRFIEYFSNNPTYLQGFFTKANKCKTDNCLDKLYASMFPTEDMGPYTHSVMEKIIQNCPLLNNIGDYKPSNNPNVNKVIKPSKSYGPTRKVRSHTRRTKKQQQQKQCPPQCNRPNPPSGCGKCLRRVKHLLWGFDKHRKSSRRKSRRRSRRLKSRRRGSRRKSRRRSRRLKSRRRGSRRKSRRGSRRLKSSRRGSRCKS